MFGTNAGSSLNSSTTGMATTMQMNGQQQMMTPTAAATIATTTTTILPTTVAAATQQHQQQQINGIEIFGNTLTAAAAAAGGGNNDTNMPSVGGINTTPIQPHGYVHQAAGSNNFQAITQNPQQQLIATQRWPPSAMTNGGNALTSANNLQHPQHPQHQHPQLTATASNNHIQAAAAAAIAPNQPPNGTNIPAAQPSTAHGAQHFDGSFEFLKYLRHSSDFNHENNSSSNNNNNNNSHAQQQQQISSQQQQQQQTAAASILDLDSSTSQSQKSRSASRKVAAMLSSVSRASNSLESTLDVFDHDSKHTLFELQHINNSSNSNESSMEMSNIAFPSSHLNASNSNTSSEDAADLAPLRAKTMKPSSDRPSDRRNEQTPKVASVCVKAFLASLYLEAC